MTKASDSSNRTDWLTRIKDWKAHGHKIVFTNGCFDILHYGHVQYLSSAAALGDRLIIGVNTDASVKRQEKGPERPINDLHSRMEVLKALRFVDAVIPFEEDTPLNLIKQISPDILVKGGDYKVETIVGAEWVQKQGGHVQVLPFVPGFSTTDILSKLK